VIPKIKASIIVVNVHTTDRQFVQSTIQSDTLTGITI